MIVVTSWDDGHPLDTRVASLLQKHGLRGTFFVPIRNAEGRPVMNFKTVRALAEAGHEIGGHTLDHLYLPGLGLAAAESQVGEGKRRLEDMLGSAVLGFCYPGGKVNRFVRSVVASVGFRYARTVENLRLEMGTDPFMIPTTLQLFPHPPHVLLANFLRGGHHRARIPVLQRVLRARSWPDRVRAVVEAHSSRDAVLHLWGHSWEIEEHGLWGELDALLGDVSRHAKAATIGELQLALERP